LCNINILILSDDDFVSNSKVISIQAFTANLRLFLHFQCYSYQKLLDLYDVV